MCKCKINVIENGPLMVEGDFELQLKDGTIEKKSKAALCRCGHSQNKPYCDGSHVKADFKG